jgi:hypothetical protein
MQNDNLPTGGTQYEPAANQPMIYEPVYVDTPVNRNQNILEYIMLALGIVTLASFFVNNGLLLKTGLVAVLAIGILTILKNILATKAAYNYIPPPATYESSQQSMERPQKKPRSLAKILGITLLVIICLPVIGYASLMIFIIAIVMMNGGQGT